MSKHPKFQRPNRSQKKRVRDSWRKPHGIDSKQRQKLVWAGATVKIGYRSAKKGRHWHPQGKPEVLVRNAKELEGVEKEVLVRLAGGISQRNKDVLRKKALHMGVKVLN